MRIVTSCPLLLLQMQSLHRMADAVLSHGAPHKFTQKRTSSNGEPSAGRREKLLPSSGYRTTATHTHTDWEGGFVG
uniref:Putative secreted protein n=1 Tax=Anopheles darlingi TaxID=43151 RepID=A0A2M4D4Y4_ANODA